MQLPQRNQSQTDGGVAGPTLDGAGARAGVKAAVVSVAIVHPHLPLMVQPVVPVASTLQCTTSRIFTLTNLIFIIAYTLYLSTVAYYVTTTFDLKNRQWP